MSIDFATFFDIYMRPSESHVLQRDGIEFRYAAATLLVACSKSDLDEDPLEKRVIVNILQNTLGLSHQTIARILEFANSASEESYLAEIIALIKNNFAMKDKRFLMEKLWQVAYADGRIDRFEQTFINDVASQIEVGRDDVIAAQALASSEPL